MDEEQQASDEMAVPDGCETWNAYWATQGMPWRTESEIDEARQQFLAARRALRPNIKQGIYPFKDIKLNRADVEWLLATHDSDGVVGPVDFNDAAHRDRQGIDLRGADLRQEDLRWLPLDRVRAGLSGYDTPFTIDEIEPAAAHCEGADLGAAHLNGAALRGVHLEAAYLDGASLVKAELHRAHLAAAWLGNANLEDTSFHEADLTAANLQKANLADANLDWTRLYGADLRYSNLEGANFRSAYLGGGVMDATEEQQIRAWQRDFAHYIHELNASASPQERIALMERILSSQPPTLTRVLYPADLRKVCMDSKTVMDDATLGGKGYGLVSLGRTRLGEVDWSSVKGLGEGHLGDERLAQLDERKLNARFPLLPFNVTMASVGAFEDAMRANRQLATALRDQGMVEEADRFAYRARVMQRKVYFRRVLLRSSYPSSGIRSRIGSFGSWLLSLFLDVLAGYGYHPLNTLLWYIAVICGFAVRYYALSQSFISSRVLKPFSPTAALVFSISSFHGRGFFPGPGLPLDHPIIVLAAMEAIIGLIIEVSVIATFTQRFFAR